MPRPPQSEHQRNQVRHRILDAAQDLFDTSGVEGVSMRALGARVGLTASALYAYFPSKTHLMRALWQSALEALLAKLLAISQRETDPMAAIEALAAAYSEFAIENTARFRVLHMLDRHDLVGDPEQGSLREEAYQVLRQRVVEAIGQRRLRFTDPDLVSQLLWTGMHGVLDLTTSISGFRFLSSSLLIPSMINTLLTGMKSVPSKE